MTGKEKILFVHGVTEGEGFSPCVKATVDLVYNPETFDVEYYDYSEFLDSVRWPRFVPGVFSLFAWFMRRSGEFNDVKAWVFAPGKRTELVTNLALKMLTDGPYDRVVGHSLGSIILWQVLQTGAFPNQVAYFIGSPLAHTFIRRFSGHSQPPAEMSPHSVIVSGIKDPITNIKGTVELATKSKIGHLVVNSGHELVDYLTASPRVSECLTERPG